MASTVSAWRKSVGGGEAGEAGQVVIAGFVFVGQHVGLAILVALGAGAAAAEGFQFAFDAGTHVKDAGAERS